MANPDIGPILYSITCLLEPRPLYFRYQQPGEWTDSGFDSEILRSAMVATSLPQMLIADSLHRVALEHPFPIVFMPSHAVIKGWRLCCIESGKHSVCCRRGDIVSLRGCLFQNREYLIQSFCYG